METTSHVKDSGVQLAHCRLCRSPLLEMLFEHQGIPVNQCRGCGMVFFNPQPSDETLARIYSSSYFLGAAQPGGADHVSRLKTHTAQLYLDALAGYGARPSGALLEIGCGRGELLAEASSRGFEVQGLDMSPHAVRAANERLGRAAAVCADSERAPWPAHSFDVCVCADVVEHTRDPVEFLSRVHRLLKPNGTLLLVTPALDTSTARLLRQYWFEFKVEHLYYFTRATMQHALASAGFQGVEIETARKVLSLGYLVEHFRRYPVPVLSPLLSAAGRLIPSIARNVPLRMPTTGMLVLAHAGVRRSRPLVSIIVPVFNERKTVSAVLDKLLEKKLDQMDKEIIVIEGNSTDGTREAVRGYQDAPDVRLILQDRPNGKGAAVREGLRVASGDFVLIQDADLEYDIDDYDKLLEPLRLSRAAVVLGNRHSGKWRMRKFIDQVVLEISFNLGHVFLTGLFNLLYGQKLNDPWTMFKVFRRDCLQNLAFECNRFNFDVELLAKLIRKGYAPIEIPVSYHSRSFHEGKKIRVMTDPWTWIWACIKYRIVSPYGEKTRISSREHAPDRQD